MISHKNKFIIILPPKNGTTSITSALMDVCDISKIHHQPNIGTFDFYEPGYEQQLRKHASLNSYLNKKEHVRNYKLYGLVRNPYARMVSWWKWNLRNTGRKEAEFPLLEFLTSGNEWKWWSMKKYFHTDHECKHQLKFIRNENMQEDFLNFCTDVGLNGIDLPQKNSTKHKHYTEYYDDETREIVASRFAEDLELYGYGFGDQ